MITKEIINEIDMGILSEYRNKMSELIFISKNLDGPKQRNYQDICKEIQVLESEFRKRLKIHIDEAEKSNTHPKNIKIDNLYNGYFDFWSFDTIPTKPIYQEIFFGEDTEPLRGITNSENYLEPHLIFKLIERWYKVNKKAIPLNRRKVSFYFDFDFYSAIIQAQWHLLASGRTDEIQHLDCCRIYHHWKNNRADKNRLKLSKLKLLKFSKYYFSKSHLLSTEQHFNDRGHILVDYQYLFKVNGKYVFEFYSKFFWIFFDALFELHLNNPELFGKGADLIIEGLFKLMNNLPKYKELNFVKNIQEFKLALQQNYAYFGNLEKGLRIDLFRNIVPDKKKPDILTFEGGLFHVLRHFENDDKPISATFEGGHQFYESYFFDVLREAFWVSVWQSKGNNVVSIVHSQIKQNKDYQFVFYKNPHADGLYFIDTMHLKKRK